MNSVLATQLCRSGREPAVQIRIRQGGTIVSSHVRFETFMFLLLVIVIVLSHLFPSKGSDDSYTIELPHTPTLLRSSPAPSPSAPRISSPSTDPHFGEYNNYDRGCP